MASKPKAATRASTRIKSQIPAPQGTRVTRAKVAVDILAPLEVKKKVTRKPLASKENDPDVGASRDGKIPAKEMQKNKEGKFVVLKTDDREPIMAFLRIRPYLGDSQPTCLPYLTPLSDTSVCMKDPNQVTTLGGNRIHPSTLPTTSKYTFSHLFLPDTTQREFFTKTTLPLVNDVLSGQNALLFAYGVTNSGKTYTVHGGTEKGSAGIVPRTLDVIFNSIEGLQGDGRYRPVRLQDIELSDLADVPSPELSLSEPALREVFAEHLDPSALEPEVDTTSVKVDRNYSYCIWLSYAEIYNEKVYDLLENVRDDSSSSRSVPSNLPHSLRVTRKALQLKSCPRSDSDPPLGSSPGKYVDGLRQFRVQSASQAKALLKLGQIHRRVFGTLANRESSRSHALVIIKVVKGHRGEGGNMASFQVSRLTLVDLAGSERNKQAQTTGDRLKEAGNINKSLMVLGQCLEALRANQRRMLANAIVEVGKTDIRESRKALAVVPFRHSKLTEVLMDYFAGDGRVVMIVNVNPFDTGYDENSNVMKFAALAREVYVMPAQAPARRIPATGPLSPTKAKSKPVAQIDETKTAPRRRKVTISVDGKDRKTSGAVVEILEEDEPNDQDDGESDVESINPLVDALFDEIEELRHKLFECEMRCALVEAETREEVMKEMEERMRSMERMHIRRLMNEVEENEKKTDAKIDLLHQSGMFGNSPLKKSSSLQHVFPQEHQDTARDDFGFEEELAFHSDEESESDSNPATSPLARKVQKMRQFVPDGPEAILLPSDDEEMTERTETDDDEDELESVIESRTSEPTDSITTDDEDDWVVPAPERTPRPLKSTSTTSIEVTFPDSLLSLVAGKGTVKRPTRVTRLTDGLTDLSITSDDAIDLLSPKKAGQRKEQHAQPKTRQPARKAAVSKGQEQQAGGGRSTRSRKAR